MPKPALSRKGFGRILSGILVVALIVRVAAVIDFRDIPLVTDATDYDRHAVSIASGHGYPQAQRRTGGPGPTAFRPPLYPYFLGTVYAVSGTSNVQRRQDAGRLAQAVLGVAIVALTALIALQLWGYLEALVAAAIAAVYPPLVQSGTTLLTEPLFTVLLLAGVAASLLWRGGDDRWRWLVLAGVCGGLAALTRTNGVIVAGMLTLGAWVVRPRWSWRALRAPATVALAAALAVTPWLIRNAVEFNSFVPISTQTGFALAGLFNDGARDRQATWIPPEALPQYQKLFSAKPNLGELEIDRRLGSDAVDYATSHPTYVLSAAFWNAARFLSLDHPVRSEQDIASFSGEPEGLARWSVYAFWLIALLAIGGTFTAAARRMPAFVWALPIVFMLSIVLVGGLSRYRAPVEPIFILLAAVGLLAGLGRLRNRTNDPVA